MSEQIAPNFSQIENVFVVPKLTPSSLPSKK